MRPACLSVLATVVSQLPFAAIQAEILHSFTEPYQTSALATDDSGVLRSVSVQPGQKIKAGQIIAKLDTAGLEASLSIAQMRADSSARIRAAEAKAELAATRKSQLDTIDVGGYTTNLELARSRADSTIANSELQLAEEEQLQNRVEVTRLKAEIERRIVRSPFDGIITKLHKRVGEYSSAGDPTIATLVRIDRLRVKFYVRSSIAETLHRGSVLRVETAGRQQDVTVEFVSPVTDPDSGTARIDVIIDNSRENHRCGVPCRLILNDRIQHNTALATRKKTEN